MHGPVEGLAFGPVGDGVPGLGRQMSQPPGDGFDGFGSRMDPVIDVAGEKLIRPFAAEDAFDVLRGQLGEEEERDAGRIGIRLIQVPLDLGEGGEGLFIGQFFGGVVEFDDIGQLFGLFGFVVSPLAEADRIGVFRAGDGGHVRGIDAGGEERADFHIGNLVGGHGVFHRLVDVVHQRFELLPDLAEMLVIVAVDLHHSTAISEIVAFGQFENAFEEGLVQGGVLEGQIRFDGLLVELLVEVRVGEEGFDFGSVKEAAVHDGIVEGFDAEVVAGAEELLFFLVPDDEGEHAADFPQKADPPLFVAMKEDLGVGMGAEGVAQGDEPLAQGLVVVDFAVEGDDQVMVFVIDGLVSAFEVDDAQAAEAQGRVVIHMLPIGVGPAVGDLVGHRLQKTGFFDRGKIVDKTGDSAHNSSLSSALADTNPSVRGSREEREENLGRLLRIGDYL